MKKKKSLRPELIEAPLGERAFCISCKAVLVTVKTTPLYLLGKHEGFLHNKDCPNKCAVVSGLEVH